MIFSGFIPKGNRPIPRFVSKMASTLQLAACFLFLFSCSIPNGLEKVSSAQGSSRAIASGSRTISGPNGTVAVSGMTATSLTVTYTPGMPITSARLFLTEGNGNGLVLASQGMTDNAGSWSFTFSHPTFTDKAKIGLTVLQNVNGVEKCVPQGILSNSTTWASFTYGSVTAGFTVGFDGQGATAEASPAYITVSAPATTVSTLPAPPRRPGFNFEGWNTAADGRGSAFTANTPVTGDITVYAQWTSNGGQLVLSGPNGSVSVTDMFNSSLTVSYTPTVAVADAKLYLTEGNGTGLVLASRTMSKAGNTWSATFSHPTFTPDAKIYLNILQVSNGREICVPQGILANSTSWASFSYGTIPVSYTVNFDSQGATVEATPASLTVTTPAVTVAALPAAPVKTGFRFGGWFTLANGGGSAFTAATPVSSNMTVYAFWTPVTSCTVSFDSQGATVPATPASMTVLSGDTLAALPSPPQKTGFAFAGWYTAPSGEGSVFTAATQVNANITLYAKWGTDAGLLPLVEGMHMTMQFANKTNGTWRDDQVYLTMLVRNKAGQWCWVKADGTLQPMSLADNGQLSKNGRQCANYSLRLSDIPGFQLPKFVDSGRVFVSLGSPIYLTINIDGNGQVAYAAPDLNNATDPNADVYFDWYEFAIVNAVWEPGSPVGFWGNTTQVDQLSIPLLARVYEKNGTAGGTLIGTNGISESRTSLWASWDSSVPAEFQALKGQYRINAPCKDKNGFGLTSANRAYYDSYVNRIWDKYRTQTLSFRMDWNGANHLYTGRVQGDAFVFQQDGQESIVAVARKPNATEIFEASGVLATGNTREGAIQARIAAAFNRHVMDDSSLWDTPSAFYLAAPANFYSKFMHEHAYGGGAYGFAYDDVGNFSGALSSYNGRAVVIDIAW